MLNRHLQGPVILPAYGIVEIILKINSVSFSLEKRNWWEKLKHHGRLERKTFGERRVLLESRNQNVMTEVDAVPDAQTD